MENVIELVKANYQELLTVGAIMVSAIIIFIGILKPILFNKIACKPLRKALLALADVVFSFAATAIYFLIEGWTWENYWIASGAVTIACIVVYWLYENTCFRNLIEKLGWLAIKKFGTVFSLIAEGANAAKVETQIKTASRELKATAQTELKNTVKSLTISSQKDKELKNL